MSGVEVAHAPALETEHAAPAHLESEEQPQAEGVHQQESEYVGMPVTYAAPPVTYTAAPVTYTAAPVTYAAAPVHYTTAPLTSSFMVAPATVHHYTWNGQQYASMEEAIAAMSQGQAPAAESTPEA